MSHVIPCDFVCFRQFTANYLYIYIHLSTAYHFLKHSIFYKITFASFWFSAQLAEVADFLEMANLSKQTFGYLRDCFLKVVLIGAFEVAQESDD